jgi:hypothetical protein
MASSSSSSAADVDFRCPICLQTCIEPVVAQCTQHTYCKACLASWIVDATSARKPATCVECRAVIQQDPAQLRVHAGIAAAISRMFSVSSTASWPAEDYSSGSGSSSAEGEAEAEAESDVELPSFSGRYKVMLCDGRTAVDKTMLDHEDDTRLRYEVREAILRGLELMWARVELSDSTLRFYTPKQRLGSEPPRKRRRVGNPGSDGVQDASGAISESSAISSLDVVSDADSDGAADNDGDGEFHLVFCLTLTGCRLWWLREFGVDYYLITTPSNKHACVIRAADPSWDDRFGYLQLSCLPLADLKDAATRVQRLRDLIATHTGMHTSVTTKEQAADLETKLYEAKSRYENLVWTSHPEAGRILKQMFHTEMHDMCAFCEARLFRLSVEGEPGTMQVFVRTPTGRVRTFNVKSHYLVEELKLLICDSEQLPPWRQILQYQYPLRNGDTLSQHKILEESTIHLRLFLPGDIGVFVAADEQAVRAPPGTRAADFVGAKWLRTPEFAAACGDNDSDAPTPACIAAAVSSLGGKLVDSSDGSTDVVHGGPAVLDSACRERLIAAVDAAWKQQQQQQPQDQPQDQQSDAVPAATGNAVSEAVQSLQQGVLGASCSTDYRLLMSREELQAAVGRAAYAAVVQALQCEPDTIALRRTVASGRWINLHKDTSARTVQVPLSDDAQTVGGRLVLLSSDGRVVPVVRRAGALLAHDGDIVHGVTSLVCGVRYGLYALKARASP